MEKLERIRDIEIDLACISWARRQKEREVRKALQASKDMKKSNILEKVLLANHQEEHKAKRHNVITDELSRMYIFDDADLHRLQTEEENEKQKYKQRLERHLQNIGMLDIHIRNGPPPKTAEEQNARTAGLSQLKTVGKEVNFEINRSADTFFDKVDSDKWKSPLKLI